MIEESREYRHDLQTTYRTGDETGQVTSENMYTRRKNEHPGILSRLMDPDTKLTEFDLVTSRAMCGLLLLSILAMVVVDYYRGEDLEYPVAVHIGILICGTLLVFFNITREILWSSIFETKKFPDQGEVRKLLKHTVGLTWLALMFYIAYAVMVYCNYFGAALAFGFVSTMGFMARFGHYAIWAYFHHDYDPKDIWYTKNNVLLILNDIVIVAVGLSSQLILTHEY